MVVAEKSRVEEGGQVNVLLLGAHNVGKTALTVRFLTRRFIGEYGDIESVYSRVDRIDGQEICINIWDSQAVEESLPGGDRRLRWADGVLLVYDICDRRSFEAARRRLRALRRRWALPVLLAGNKRDLHPHRGVSGEEGRRLAREKHCTFLEVSAADGHHGAMMAFHRLVREVRGGQGGHKVHKVHKVHNVNKVQEIQDVHKVHKVHKVQGVQEGQGVYKVQGFQERRRSSTGVLGIVRSVSAVFGKRRTE